MSDLSNPAAALPVCVVTGGTSGIGLATARRFARAGYRIAICGRQRARVEMACQSIAAAGNGAGVIGIELDLSQPHRAEELIDRALAEFGGIDVLVHCAAAAPMNAVADFSDQEFDSAIDVNVRTPFFLTRAAWRALVRQGRGGTIFNISSLSAVDPYPGLSVYGACKAWGDLFSMAIAREGKPHRIRVFSLRPGAVDTPMLRGLFPDFPAEQALEPETVADVIWNLCQDSFRDCSGFPIHIQRS